MKYIDRMKERMEWRGLTAKDVIFAGGTLCMLIALSVVFLIGLWSSLQ